MNATVSQPEIRNSYCCAWPNRGRSRTSYFELCARTRSRQAHSRTAPNHFYIGHLEAFDWNLIASHALGLGAAHKELDRLFAFGIDPVETGLPQDSPSDWPRLSEINAYNCVSGKDSTTFSRDPRRLRRDLGNIPKK